MRGLVFFLFVNLFSVINAQSADDYFNSSAYEYLQNNHQTALEFINKGIDEYPGNKKLQELKKRIEEEQEQNQQGEGNKQNTPNDGQDQKQDPSQNNQNAGQQDGRNEGEQGSGSSDQDPLNATGSEESNHNRDQGARLKQHRYDNILKALEQQEQNTQRRLMMGKSKSKLGRKQKDW
ncbi:MAG: hypothetical protein Q4G27_08045 [Flavobacteriaceae bacterium]|nr:hypothetical protein [Flavobacteriaceae bacterium]